METYIDADGVERCDNCNEPVDECPCACTVCGDTVMECACPEGQSYPATPEN